MLCSQQCKSPSHVLTEIGVTNIKVASVHSFEDINVCAMSIMPESGFVLVMMLCYNLILKIVIRCDFMSISIRLSPNA